MKQLDAWEFIWDCLKEKKPEICFVDCLEKKIKNYYNLLQKMENKEIDQIPLNGHYYQINYQEATNDGNVFYRIIPDDKIIYVRNIKAAFELLRGDIREEWCNHVGNPIY